MALRKADINITIGADIKEFKEKMRDVSSRVSEIGQKMALAGAALTVAVTRPLAGLASTAIRSSGVLNEELASIQEEIKKLVKVLVEDLVSAFNLKENIPKFIAAIKAFTEKWKQLNPVIKKVAFVIGGLVVAAGPLMAIFGSLATLMPVITGLFSALLGPVGLVVGALVGVAGAVLYVVKNWEAFKERFSDIAWWRNTLVDMAKILLNALTIPFRAIFDAIETLTGKNLDFVGSAIDGLDKLKGATKEYKNEFMSFGDFMKSLKDDVVGKLFSGGSVYEDAKELGNGVAKVAAEFENLGTVARRELNSISSSMDKVIGKAQKIEVSIDMESAIQNSPSSGIKERIQQLFAELNAQVQTFATDFGVGFGETIGNMLSGQDDAFQNFGQQILNSIGDFLKSIGKALIGYGMAMEAFKEAFTNPIVAIAAGIAAVALGQVIKNYAQNGPQAFANGGLVYGPTLGLVGEYAGARSNPEVIAPLSKLQGMLGGAGGRLQGEFVLRGSDAHLLVDMDEKERRRRR